MSAETQIVMGVTFIIAGIAGLLALRINEGRRGQAMKDAAYRATKMVFKNVEQYPHFQESLRRPLSIVAILMGVVFVVFGIVRY